MAFPRILERLGTIEDEAREASLNAVRAMEIANEAADSLGIYTDSPEANTLFGRIESAGVASADARKLSIEAAELARQADSFARQFTGLPVGSVIFTVYRDLPGFLPCDGETTLKKSDYVALYACMGAPFQTPETEDTFRLPRITPPADGLYPQIKY